MEIDYSGLLAVWISGWGCGALSWYWVLKFFDGDYRTNKSKNKGK